MGQGEFSAFFKNEENIKNHSETAAFAMLAR
jgi:hypothetical protein